ncbi:lipid IV(A) 3-deoxy-D-manno-octulosonic acid transferase [Rheinheimera salexigens]|uniref:3-deoxy-D-manno-octulosonic acid kinase n=1 Tax=Rheinheimera salexigens TaxID=1628148 RepID=A0A1E7Q3S8_9GAMM|nr:lipid IV(A) 3-deoxy-D-manno-octulosonic acid transferase [Rheinheimera salexigens]OEY68807.1 3-deoxy-D-manno-octulosonic acid transferase [Rheinheimera salexigens]
MPVWCSRLLYQVVIYILLPLLLLYFIYRSFKDVAYRQRFSERFAWQSVPVEAVGGIVVHAVSVGEVVAATPLIKRLMQQYPNLPITVTCTTPTGSERIKQTFADTVFHYYLQIDTPGAVKRFLTKLQPTALIILETELWPNLLQQCQTASIPSIIVNARLSVRSAKGYRRGYCFSQLLLPNISLLLSQDRATLRRFRALGYTGAAQVCGNVKYDMAIPDHVAAMVQQLTPQLQGRPIWVAGSTHAGEDQLLINACKQLKKQFDNILLIIVPRHLERFDTVAELIQRSDLTMQRRSSGEVIRADTNVLLGDTMGELLAWYQLANVVFIGGSLIERGGHNPLEAMCFAKPIQSGPYVFNFAQAYKWLAQREAINWLTDEATLVANTQLLLEQPELAQQQGAAGLALYQQHSGACQRIVQAITNFLPADVNHFRQQQQGSQQIWYQSDVFSNLSAEQFNPEHWQHKNAIIGQSQGRNTAWFIQHQDTRIVLRHYYRGGLMGKLLHDQFSLVPVTHSRAMQEFALLRRMHSMGLPVPRPIAANYQRDGLIYRADIMIELVAQCQDLATVLSHRELSATEWQNVGKTIAQFHQQGVYHSDLNCRNILLDAKGQIWLIDFDKCAIRQLGAWRHENLQRLQRSLIKEQGLAARFYWHLAQWPELELGYQKQLNG